VLSFDFRGHGDSTNVGPGFWQAARANTSHIKGAAANKQKISYKEFAPAYIPMLVNDIAAAKRYLDVQNNAKVSNSSNVILIGAEDGAALGLLWAASEWHRERLGKDAFGRPVVHKNPPEFEGEDLACAVWLSATPTTSKGGFHVNQCLLGPANKKLREKVPM